jgi:hypothetical protein
MLKLKYKMTEVITTNYLDPIYHDTSRSLFKIYPQSDEVRSNLRIVRYQPITTTDNFNGTQGLYQIFKSIKLSTLDQQVLDEWRYVPQLMDVMNAVADVGSVQCLKSFQDGNAISITVDKETGLQTIRNQYSKITSYELTLDLHKISSYLRNLPNVNNGLVIEIQYQAIVNSWGSNPLLAYDIVVNSSAMTNYTVPYSVFMNDGVRFTGAGIKQRITGFNGKNISRLMIMVQDGTGDYNQIKQKDQILQIYVNGNTILPYGGVQYGSQQLAYLLDSVGGVAYPINHLYDINNGANMDSVVLTNALGTASHQSLNSYSFFVNNKINELVIEYTCPNNGAGTSLNLMLFAEVSKVANHNGGKTLVSFA